MCYIFLIHLCYIFLIHLCYIFLIHLLHSKASMNITLIEMKCKDLNCSIYLFFLQIFLWASQKMFLTFCWGNWNRNLPTKSQGANHFTKWYPPMNDSTASLCKATTANQPSNDPIMKYQPPKVRCRILAILEVKTFKYNTCWITQIWLGSTRSRPISVVMSRFPCWGTISRSPSLNQIKLLYNCIFITFLKCSYHCGNVIPKFFANFYFTYIYWKSPLCLG